jgi:UDP-N-acetylmuramoylalanine--D-glutamate ligase
MEIKGKHITVVGLGKTGVALADFLNKRGALVTVTDQAPETSFGEAALRLKKSGVRLELGGHGPDVFEKADLIVLSPGVSHCIEPVKKASEAGILVTGEIELASGFINTPIVAVTGTNGKSTVTRLIGKMLEAGGLKTFVGGNLGTPLISYADSSMEADVAVAEISSFQLDTAESFHPRVGVLLNITPDHLDRYSGIRAYGRCKAKLFARQNKYDTAVLNAGDNLVMELTRDIVSRKCFFNSHNDHAGCGAVIYQDSIYLQTPWTDPFSVSVKDIPLAGRHNMENVSAAALAALAAGGSVDGVLKGLKNFRPDPHRIEWVGLFDKVNYYDDSKATNVDAVVRAVEAVGGKIVLIMGGRDKGGGYKGLKDAVKKYVKAIVLLGEASDAIDRDLGALTHTKRAFSMNEAVAIAAGFADPGDSVLLSPACSSFDMYENYARRGDDFQRAVRQTGANSERS